MTTLTLIFALPLLAAIALAFVPRNFAVIMRAAAVGVTFVTMLLAVPVFLLHGIDDNVIPAIESEYLANDLRGHAPVRLLLSGLISHAEADQPAHVGDVMKLAEFWGDLLSR